jgi:hypothetical protein
MGLEEKTNESAKKHDLKSECILEPVIRYYLSHDFLEEVRKNKRHNYTECLLSFHNNYCANRANCELYSPRKILKKHTIRIFIEHYINKFKGMSKWQKKI